MDEYFIDAKHGDDSNDGRSESSPWKTLNAINKKTNSNKPFKILLKKGQIWRNQSMNIRRSGNRNSPIIISSYGDGDVKPIISGVSSLNESILPEHWEYAGDYIWRTKEKVKNPGRLFKQYNPQNTNLVKELVKAYDIKNLGKKTYSILDEKLELDPDIWYWSNNNKEGEDIYKKLYVFNGSDSFNPSNQFGKATIFKSTNSHNSYRHINCVGQEHIIIDDIEFQGGVVCIFIGESRNIHIRNCNIGKHSTHGINILNSDFVTIDNNCFDSAYKGKFGLSANTLNHKTFPHNLRGTDSRGIGDGLNIVNDGSECIISNNRFTNWVHCAISLLSKSPKNNGIHSNKIFNNTITSNGLTYSRGFAIAGVSGGVYKNEIYNNAVFNTRVNSQLAGESNNFHNNTIDTVNQSDVRLPGSANGIIIANNKWNYVAEGNTFDFNTILKCDDAGFNINNWGSPNNPRNPVKNNRITNNTIRNCGKQVNGKNDHIGISIADGSRSTNPSIEGNEYSDNIVISKDSKGNRIKEVISYHKQKMDVLSFNQAVLKHNDKASNNSEEPGSIS